MNPPSRFPLSGIVGIVNQDAQSLTTALKAGLSAVEVRADRLLAAGLSVREVIDRVAMATRLGLGVLFTLRHKAHGGEFDGGEDERVGLFTQALAAGARIVDAEWRSEAARRLLQQKQPLLLSHHDFTGMVTAAQFSALEADALSAGVLGIKVVPTAGAIADAARILHWVASRSVGEPHRIGFAMGAIGAFSRVLCIAFGSPITYASLDHQAVAPGQLPLHQLQRIYAPTRLQSSTRVYGVVGNNANASLSPQIHNHGFIAGGVNAVYVPFQTQSLEQLMPHLDALRIDGLSVTTPFKEDALRFSDVNDQRSVRCGAANTLCIDRDRHHKTSIRAINTDVDGVLIPITRRRSPVGATVAIIGNGGAARGAIQAMKEAMAIPTLFCRNLDKGLPVAQAFQIPAFPLSAINDRFDVYINTTPSPSPLPIPVFSRREQIAFNMDYSDPAPEFLRAARAIGADCIDGREMLIDQGAIQFEHFTGRKLPPETFTSFFSDQALS